MKFLWILVLAVEANAANILIEPSGPTQHIGSQYIWNYEVFISPGTRLDSTTLITLYEFKTITLSELLTGAGNPADWSATTQSIGVTPFGVMPIDTALSNLTWRYTGATVNGPLLVSNFSISSTLAWRQTVLYAAVTGLQPGQTGDGMSVDIGFLVVPGTVPEPSSMALVGMGLAVLIYRLNLRRPSRPSAGSVG